MNLDTGIKTHHKNKLKMDCRPKCKPAKLLEDDIGENLHNFQFDDEFLDVISKA